MKKKLYVTMLSCITVLQLLASSQQATAMMTDVMPTREFCDGCGNWPASGGVPYDRDAVESQMEINTKIVEVESRVGGYRSPAGVSSRVVRNTGGGGRGGGGGFGFGLHNEYLHDIII